MYMYAFLCMGLVYIHKLYVNDCVTHKLAHIPKQIFDFSVASSFLDNAWALIIIYRPRSLCIVHVGFAENGLENLPCPSSLLLGVLVTLLPKVTIIVTCITI